MYHPFESIRPGRGKYIFLPALVLYVVIQVVFAFLDVPLRTPAAPAGIVSFELAASATQARAILDSWEAFARLDAAFGLGIDFLFMLAYSTVIGLACIWAARTLATRSWPLAVLGPPLAWGVWLAALCDSLENIALLAQLLNGAAEPYPQIAAFCAAVKFLLIIIGLLFMAYGASAWLIVRRGVAERRQESR